MQNAVAGHLGADDHFVQCGHYVHYAAEGNEVVLGPFASGNVSTRQSLLLPGLAPLLAVFTEKQSTQWAIERSLLFTSKVGPSR